MENKVLKPKIRFKGFADTWEQRKLGDISNSFSGGTPLVGNSEFYGGKIPFIRSGEIHGNTTEIYITDKGLNSSSAKLVRKGDILYALYGATSGEVDISRIDGAINQAILAIFPNKNYNNIFITNYLKKEKENIISTYLQGGQGNLSGEIVKNVDIKLPNYEEQKQIGKLFEQLDNLITLHQSKYDKLVNVKKVLLEKMFPKDGKNVPEIRFKGFTDTWEQRKLNELTSIITKGTTPLDKINEGTVNFVKIENIDSFSGKIDITSKITEKEHNSYLKRSQLKENDLLFSIAGTLGRVAVVKSSILPANTNQALAIIRLKNGDINYIKTYLKCKTISDFIRKNPTIGAQPNLSLEQVNNFDIIMPDKEEQQKLSALFNSIDNLITLHQHKLEKLKNMKKSLLNKMFI